MAGPTQLNPTEQDALVKQIGLALLRAAPADWTSVEVAFRALGRYTEVRGQVSFADERTAEFPIAPEVVGLFARLRAGMYREGRGTWFNARYQLDRPAAYNLEYDRDEPHWQSPPPPPAFVDELRMFPRDEENVPEWLSRRLTAMTPPFRTARIFDGMGPAGPVLNRPPLEDDERERLQRYLDAAPLALPARGYDTDHLDEERRQTVPVAFHTDGTWIWPAAVNFYLRTHGVPPDPDLVAHARRVDFAMPEVDDQAREAAAAFIAGPRRPARPPQPEPPVEQPAVESTEPEPAAQPDLAAEPDQSADEPNVPDPVTVDDPLPPPSDAPADVVAHLRDRLDDLGIDPGSYTVGTPSGPGWTMEQTGQGWRVGWFDGHYVAPAVFADASDAAAFLAGKLLLADPPASRPDPGPSTVRASLAELEDDDDDSYDQRFRMPAPPPSRPVQSGPSGDDLFRPARPVDPPLFDDEDEDYHPARYSRPTEPNALFDAGPDTQEYADPNNHPPAHDDPAPSEPSPFTPANHFTDEPQQFALPPHDQHFTDEPHPFTPPDQPEPRDHSTDEAPHFAQNEPVTEDPHTFAQPETHPGEHFTDEPHHAQPDHPRNEHPAQPDPQDEHSSEEPRHFAQPDQPEASEHFTHEPHRFAQPNHSQGEHPTDAGHFAQPNQPQNERFAEAAPHQPQAEHFSDERHAVAQGDQPQAGDPFTGGAHPFAPTGQQAAGFSPPGHPSEQQFAAAHQNPAEHEQRQFAPAGQQPQFAQRDAQFAPGGPDAQPFSPSEPQFAPGGPEAQQFSPGEAQFGQRDSHFTPGDAHFTPGGPEAQPFTPGEAQFGQRTPGGPDAQPFNPGEGQLGQRTPSGPDAQPFNPGEGQFGQRAPGGPNAQSFSPSEAQFDQRAPSGADPQPFTPGEAQFDQRAPSGPDAQPFTPGEAQFAQRENHFTPNDAQSTPSGPNAFTPADTQFAQRDSHFAPGDASFAPAGAEAPPAPSTPEAQPFTPNDAQFAQREAPNGPRGGFSGGQERHTDQIPAHQEPERRPEAGLRRPQDWPIQPLAGEPPLTLFRGKQLTQLPEGTELDRYGDPTGNLTYAIGTPFDRRSLVPDWINRPYRAYRVVRPTDALTGAAIPWFDQPGGGTAYVLARSVAELLDTGFLEEIPDRKPPARA